VNLRPPPDLATLRAAWWARGALRSAHDALARGEVKGIQVPAPPDLPASAIRGVEALLRRRDHTCLEAALVRQRWFAAHGKNRQIAIGVKSPADGFLAHAWLVGDRDPQAPNYHELERLDP
jgi:hypothetical protein